MCAHGRVGQTHIDFESSPFLKEFCMARHHFVFESRLFLFLKGSRPSPLPPIPFFKSPPPQKIRMGRGGKARGRDARYSARGGVQRWHGIGAYDAIQSHHARGACEVIGSRKRFAQRI